MRFSKERKDVEDDEMTRPSGNDENCRKYGKVEGSCVDRSSLGVTVVIEEPNIGKKKDETNFGNRFNTKILLMGKRSQKSEDQKLASFFNEISEGGEEMHIF